MSKSRSETFHTGISLRSKTYLGFAFALLILGVAGLVSYRSIVGLTNDANWVTHTYEVLTRLENVIALVTDAESSVRGFVIAGDEGFLEPHSTAVERITGTVKDLRQLTADNPDQQKRLDALEPLIAQRLRVFENVIAARREKGYPAAEELVRSNQGKEITDGIRNLVHAMRNEEERLLGQREAAAKATTRKTFLVIAIGFLLSFGILLSVFYQLNRVVVRLTRAEAELDRFFTLSLDMLCIAGFDGHFKRLNPAWEQILGFSKEELLARPYLDFVHPEDRESTISEAQKLTTGAATISFENRYICKDGSYKWLLWKATPLPGQPLIYAAARDITDRKREEEELVLAKEEAERASKFKSQFLSTMSHELRTPLNAILGFSDLLSDERYGTLNDRQRRYVNHVHTAGQHLLRLINDVLDLSKIEAGRIELVMENVSVQTAFSDVVETVRLLAEKRSQTLSQNAASDLIVRADPSRLRQVLLNLAGNAIKFTPEGGNIALRARRENGPVRLEIQDNGPGIPFEEQKHIFDTFHRLRESGHTEGTGLGLAIAQRLVELQGGGMGLDSQPGQGSCFYFTLPAALPVLQEPTRQVQPGENSVPALRILVIEDDPAAGQLMQSQLTSSGYEVTICDQPQRAVELATELQPHAITLDLLMRPTSGWDVLFQLKLDPRTREIPVVVVTIVNQPARGAAFVADEYLVKPVEKPTLLAAITRCLARRGIAAPALPILVVEDDEAVREVIAEMLAAEGFAVVTAVDGAEARHGVAASLPELVILDLMLPKVSGFELLAEWRANPRTADLPVFVLTGKDLTPDEEEYLRAHTESLFRKQTQWQEDLINQLRRVLGPSRTIRQ